MFITLKKVFVILGFVLVLGVVNLFVASDNRALSASNTKNCLRIPEQIPKKISSGLSSQNWVCEFALSF